MNVYHRLQPFIFSKLTMREDHYLFAGRICQSAVMVSPKLVLSYKLLLYFSGCLRVDTESNQESHAMFFFIMLSLLFILRNISPLLLFSLIYYSIPPARQQIILSKAFQPSGVTATKENFHSLSRLVLV